MDWFEISSPADHSCVTSLTGWNQNFITPVIGFCSGLAVHVLLRMVHFEISSPTSPEYVAIVVSENVILSDHTKQFLDIRPMTSRTRPTQNDFSSRITLRTACKIFQANFSQLGTTDD